MQINKPKMNKATKLFLKDILEVMNKHNVTLWGNCVESHNWNEEWLFIDTNYMKTSKAARIRLSMNEVEGELM